MQKRPAVGVAVVVVTGGKVLLGKRRNAHGQGTWAFPGGHLEYNESIAECAKREVAEETGLTITTVTHIGFTNDIFEKEKKHYVTLFVKAVGVSGEPRVMEPEKCERWEWFPLNRLPEPRFLSLENLLKQEGIPEK